MSKEFQPVNWYWQVAGNQSRVYSSASGDYVDANAPVFVAWKADGTAPTVIDTEANLGAVLAPYYPTVPRPVPAGILAGYQQSQSDDVFQRKLVKLLFMLLNRIQILEGKPALTLAQARAYVKGVM